MTFVKINSFEGFIVSFNPWFCNVDLNKSVSQSMFEEIACQA